MRIILDVFSLLYLVKRLALSGLLCFCAKLYQIKALYIISYIFAPLRSFQYNFCIVKNVHLHSIIEKLGPIFIKFAQSISTRPDLIGQPLASSLAILQDRLEPFPTSEAQNIIENQLNQKIEDIFVEFNQVPVAAASIAQVHKATLHNGQQVAVKILRPSIKRIYKNDIKTLYSIARICNLIFGKAKKLKLLEAVAIFEKTMKFELDLLSEAAACSELRDNLSKDENVKIPEVFWDYSTSFMLTLEWIDGVSIYEAGTLEQHGASNQKMIKNLTITFLNQALRDGFFHADLHPGNILITKDGKIVLVDFGIVGRLSEKDRIGIAEILHSLIQKDYKRVAEIHVDLGYAPQNTNIMDFALACRIAAEPIVGKHIDKISIGHLLENLFKITADFGMQTQPQLILLQKTIIMLEGITKTLDEKVNMWHLAENWVKKWATQNISFDAKICRMIKNVMQDLYKLHLK